MAIEQNQAVVDVLSEVASLLEVQRANPYRVKSYRRAAETIAALPRDIAVLLEEGGVQGLTRLPTIGSGLSRTIAEVIDTGRCGMLDRLRGQLDPEQLFRTLPGIGPGLARRLHDELHVDTLEALEMAAYDGRLSHLPGFSGKRLTAIRESLDTRLASRRFSARKHLVGEPPSIAAILSVDEEYRRLAAAGGLPLITPKRFNPDGRRRLPVLHADRTGWHFTALYSNTAQAHQRHRTDDWVVIHYYDHDHEHDHDEGQCTVVTEWQGPLSFYRVVRGRETECGELYRQQPRAAAG